MAEIAGKLVDEDAYLVVLGTGDPEYEEMFRGKAAEHPERISAQIGFHNGLAHRIEAGADIFLMPSRYEPCGLSQIYSLRYGTVPVVRATGGLDDTIDEDTGFKFTEYSGEALWKAVRAAVSRLFRRRSLAGNDAPRHAKGFLLEGFGGRLFSPLPPSSGAGLNPFPRAGILIAIEF